MVKKCPTYPNIIQIGSYSQLQENNTASWLQKLAVSKNLQVVISENIHPYIFPNLAWDKIYWMKTLTGAGTTHHVSGIAVQADVFRPHQLKPPLPNIDKCNRKYPIITLYCRRKSWATITL